MTVLESVHDEHGATLADRGGRGVVAHYGRPARTHRAVRNGVGVVERAVGVVVVTGDDRVDFVDNAVSNHVPGADAADPAAGDGRGCYAVLLDPQGRVEVDLYVFNAGERLLVFTPPGRAAELADDWGEKTFIQDVEFRVATEDFATFGVHGPDATEKVASVLHEAGAPEPELTFVRGELGDVGVTVVAGEGLAGEDSYAVVCGAEGAERVFETLLTRGLNAVPFGYRTRETLTLEAGTPLFETEIEGRIPNVVGLRNALDFEKGCYVGQEVVSRIENRGRPGERVVGLRMDADVAGEGETPVPDAGASVEHGDEHVGEVTRAAVSPSLDAVVGLAVVDFESPEDASVRVGGETVAAEVVTLPFVEGSARSARLPTYE